MRNEICDLMKKRSKDPLATAVLNFTLPGLGYIYAGKRIFFGAGLLLLSAVVVAHKK